MADTQQVGTPDASEATEKTVPHKNRKVGEVVSTKMDKTIVVEVTRRVAHPLYRRIMKRKKKFLAHDETGEARTGDRVRIVECRPLSKRKCWRLEAVVLRAKRAED
ncbi:MAG: 30S ribosomal protein S17 [Acidobacteria bacterium]|nr:30S ribosomal protein S17 [Acidobacteriota bacterium]